MAANTSHTPDGRGGVLIYNGEMIMTFIKDVNVAFTKCTSSLVTGKHKGVLYLTTHRIIYINKSAKNQLHSFCMPFHCLRNVKLEQPILGANYLQGQCLAMPNGNWEGECTFTLTFNKGGCIDFGQALLRAVHMASDVFMYDSPPPYGGIGPVRRRNVPGTAAEQEAPNSNGIPPQPTLPTYQEAMKPKSD